MSTKPKRTLDEVLQAIKGSGGIKETIALRLGVVRQTVDNYLDRWATAREAFDQEEEKNLDIAESLILGNMRIELKKQTKKGNDQPVDTSDAWKYLQYRGRKRGYAQTQRNEHTGADGGPVVLRWPEDTD